MLDALFFVDKISNHFGDCLVLDGIVFDVTRSVDDSQRIFDAKFFAVANVVSRQFLLVFGFDQLEQERILQVDVQNVIGHGVDQRHFTGIGSSHQQDRAVFGVKLWHMFSFVEDETIRRGLDTSGEWNSVQVLAVFVSDLLPSLHESIDKSKFVFGSKFDNFARWAHHLVPLKRSGHVQLIGRLGTEIIQPKTCPIASGLPFGCRRFFISFFPVRNV